MSISPVSQGPVSLPPVSPVERAKAPPPPPPEKEEEQAAVSESERDQDGQSVRGRLVDISA